MAKLHQILSLKSLGFSLEDIKKNLASLNTPADVANALTEQAGNMKRQLEALSSTLSDIEALREEVLQMQKVDFKKYAAIITNLQMKNEQYRLIKYLDNKTLEHCKASFDRESALEITNTYRKCNDRAIELQNLEIAPDSEEGIQFAKELWK